MVDMTKCANCRATGLSLMPVRYTVVPASVNPSFPAGIEGPRVVDIPLDPAQYKYGMRTLREGYFYLFFESGPRGSNYWEVYSVGEDGSLYRQADTFSAQSAEPKQSCNLAGHRPERLHYICIESPDKCSGVHFAFSEHKWSPDTVVAYQGSADLRAKRMQKFDIAGWLKGQPDASKHATVADPSSLKNILEYNSGVLKNQYASNTVHRVAYYNDPKVPGQLGKHYQDGLEEVASEFTFVSRIDPKAPDLFIDKTLKAMLDSSKVDAKHAYRPVLMGIWDAIGIARELSEFRNAVNGKVHMYQLEQGEWIDTYRSLTSIEQSLFELSLERDEHHRQSMAARMNCMTDQEIQQLRVSARSQPAPRNAQMNELADDFQRLANNNLLTPDWRMRYEVANMRYNEPERSQRLTALRKEEQDVLKARENYRLGQQRRMLHDAEKAWPKCQEKLNKTIYDPYDANITAFHDKAAALVENRTQELLKWLNAELFLDTLNDYHSNQIGDGIKFNEMIGDTICGLGQSKCGIDQLGKWTLNVKASDPANLLWRAMRLNDKSATQDIQTLVDLAVQHRGTVFDASVAKWLEGSIKLSGKLADTYKKAQSFIDNAGKIKEKGYHERTKYTMIGFDKIIAGLAKPIYEKLGITKFGDHVGQRILQHTFMLRAGVDEAASIKLLKAQAAYQVTCNDQLVAFCKATNGSMDLKKLPVSEERKLLNGVWADVKASKRESALQDTRLGLVVAFFEYANILRCVNSLTAAHLDGKDIDLKVASSLFTSSLAFFGAMFDIAATSTKVIYGMMGDSVIEAIKAMPTKNSPNLVNYLFKDLGEKTIAYQRLKFTGATLGWISSAIGFGWDYYDATTKSKKGQTLMARLYVAKAIVSGTSLVFSGFVAISYAPAFAKQMALKVVEEKAADAISKRIVAMVAWRLLGIGIGGMLTIATVVIMVAIYVLDDTALQKWVDRSRFGGRHEKEPFKDVHEENEELAKALYSDS